MQELFHQLGINWKLLLGQGLNFIVLLVILRMFVYKPLTRVLEERRKKIEFGLKVSEEAEKRMRTIDELKDKTIKEAEGRALTIVAESEKRATALGKDLVIRAEEKAESLLVEAKQIRERKKAEEFEVLLREAGSFVKEAIQKTVELEPTAIDETLIKRAIEEIKKKPA